MKSRILLIILASAVVIGCSGEKEPTVIEGPKGSPQSAPEDNKASTSNQQLSINPDYKGK